MSKINVGDILENGSKVISVMKLSQDKTDIFYKLYDNINNIFIFVTGTHMVLLPNGQYGEVQTHPYAIVCPEIKASYLSCLITNDHKIKIVVHFFCWVKQINDAQFGNVQNLSFKVRTVKIEW